MPEEEAINNAIASELFNSLPSAGPAEPSVD